MGLKGPDFALVASDTAAVHSIITIKQDEDKIVQVDQHKVFCLSGEAGDRANFSEYVAANVKLYALRNDTTLSTRAVAHLARGELAAALRKVRELAFVAGAIRTRSGQHGEKNAAHAPSLQPPPKNTSFSPRTTATC